VTPRELRLRQRIDQLIDERDAALAELAAVKADIKTARAAASRAQNTDGAHAWLAEYDRRRDARRKRRRQDVAA
jgi:hypothetical protein